MQTFAVIALGVLVAVLAVLLYRRNGEVRRVRDLGERLAAVAQSGEYSERLSDEATDRSASLLAANIDLLMEKLQAGNSAWGEREGVYRRLLESMHEAVAVDRGGRRSAAGSRGPRRRP